MKRNATPIVELFDDLVIALGVSEIPTMGNSLDLNSNWNVCPFGDEDVCFTFSSVYGYPKRSG
jgi:hypothetical protein